MRRWLQFLLSLLMLAAALFLVACSGGAPGCPQATFGSSACIAGGGGSGTFGGGGGSGGGGGGGTVDASNAQALVYYGSDTVNAAGVTSSGTFGTLSNYTGPTLPNPGVPDDMVIVNKKFLYVPNGDSTVSGYSINRQTGALTLIPGSPFTVPGTLGTADDLTTDPLGQFLFVGSETAALVWSFTINSSTGALTSVNGSPFTSGFAAGGASDVVTVDASGRYLYAGQLTPSLGVAGFAIGAGGVLTPITGSPFTSVNVAQIHASPTAEILVGVQQVQDGVGGTSNTDHHIYTYAINSSTGVPTLINSFLTLQATFDFAISPNGNFVYVLEWDNATAAIAPIEGFALNSGTGVMSSLGTFSGVPSAEGCRFDQAGVIFFCEDLILGTGLTVNAANPSTGALSHVADLTVTNNYPFAVTD